MGIFEAVSAFFGKDRKEKDEERDRREDLLRQAFKARCGHFKALLSANKRALETMATLEEALKAERLFSMSFVRANCTTVTANVYNMVRHLNLLSGNLHADLFDRLKEIQQKISDIVSPKSGVAYGPLVLPLEKADYSMAHEVGGKMAGLGEALQKLGQRIPRGFVVTASGFYRFLQANDLQEEIHRRIQMTNLFDLEAVFTLSSSLQRLIIAAPMPDDLAGEILDHYNRLDDNQGRARLAVRSSAIGEDGLDASFAGQYRTELNIGGETLLETYKEVIAGKYSVTAMSYRVSHGIPDNEVPMCVGCLEMVDSLAGGVAYSRDPLGKGGEVVINAVPGLPGAVVDGSAEVDVFRVSREEPRAILYRHVPLKRSVLVRAPDEGVIKTPLNEEAGVLPSLTDDQILSVAETALLFEDFYGRPQDVEWAFDLEGRLTILQSRPLPGMEEEAEAAPLPAGVNLLLEGEVSASPGVGAGTVFIVRRDADMLRFPHGAVLVVEQAHSRWAPVVNRASGVVSEYGGVAGHLASVAREYGVPAVFSAKDATRILQDGELVTVDADSRRVLAGRVDELLSRRREPKRTFSGSPVHSALAKAVEFIVPLNLLQPESSEFAPAFCRTMHDITRYCHEKAVEEMFRTDESLFSERWGKQLKYKGGKLQYFVVNIENGFCGPVEGKYVEMDQICCPPMHALWQGMLAIPWAGPASSSARGFFAVVAESASNPELEVTSASTRMMRNYFLVDREYCNLQASFGYHFCTVEAQAGKEEQENYVNFHFKGGAANIARRLLRVNALADVLSENGFIVEVKEDALSARAEELSASDVLELLVVLGYLLIHTRQMDAALSGEDSRVAFADTLREGIAHVLKTCAL